jgi:hypothetical protein
LKIKIAKNVTPETNSQIYQKALGCVATGRAKFIPYKLAVTVGMTIKIPMLVRCLKIRFKLLAIIVE